MTEIKLLPDEIKKSWQPWLDHPTARPLQRQYLQSVVDYSLPPTCHACLLRSAEVYDMDHAENQTLPTIKGFLQQVGMEKMASRPSKQTYPLYAALTSEKHLAGASSLRSLCRQQISNWFSSPLPAAQPGLYYDHIIACRSILEIICQSENAEATGITHRLGFLVRLAGSSELASSINTKTDNYQLFLDICEGHRAPGVRIRKPSQRQKSSRIQKPDSWHDEKLCELINATPAAAAYRPSTPNDQDQGDTLPTEAQQFGIQKVKKAHVTSDEDDSPVAFQRKQFTTFTPSDDHLLIRRIVRASAASAIAHDSDLHRLPAERILNVLQSDMSDVQRITVLLLVATGLPVSRLATLRLAEESFMQPGSTMPDDDAPRWESLTATLAYRLTDGPTDNPSTANRWLVLRIPSQMGHSLTTILDNDTAETSPFARVLKRLTSYLRRYSRNRPGVNITPNRLSVSSWAWRRPPALDDVAAQWLSGSLGLGLSAPAAYRRVDRLELQAVFDKILISLGVSLDRDRPHLSPLIAGISVTSGSTHAVSPDMFKPVLQSLRQSVGHANAELRHLNCRGVQGRDAWVVLAQHLAVYTYIGWLLATGARPIGPASQNRLSGRWMWVRDKASSRGEESRVVPIISSIGDSLHYHQRWTAHTIASWTRLGGYVEDQRTHQRDTPAWFSPGRGRKTLLVRDLQHRDISPVLDGLPSLPEHASRWPANVTRHALATWLRHQCHDAEIDALLGHAHSGVSITSPRASASLGAQTALRRALRDWLSACGYQPLGWEAL